MQNVSKPNIVCHSVRVVCAAERWTASCQFVHDDAKGPPVALHVVALLGDHLGRHVLGRPTDRHWLDDASPLSRVRHSVLSGESQSIDGLYG